MPYAESWTKRTLHVPTDFVSLCPDVYDTFSNEIQAFVDKEGGEVSDNATKARVEQWILKVEWTAWLLLDAWCDAFG